MGIICVAKTKKQWRHRDSSLYTGQKHCFHYHSNLNPFPNLIKYKIFYNQMHETICSLRMPTKHRPSLFAELVTEIGSPGIRELKNMLAGWRLIEIQ